MKSLMVTMLMSLTLLASTGLPMVSAAEGDADPAVVVKHFEDVLISVMKNAEELGYLGRYKRLSAAIRESHDFPTMARIAAGKHWRRLERGQKILLTDTFTELSVANYAAKFNSYSGQEFNIESERRLRQDKALVRAVLSKPGGKERDFEYMLRRVEDSWLIVNITVDGVSDLAIKRVEFGSVIEDQGFDALIVKLREKIHMYETGS